MHIINVEGKEPRGGNSALRQADVQAFHCRAMAINLHKHFSVTQMALKPFTVSKALERSRKTAIEGQKGKVIYPTIRGFQG